MFDLLDLDLPVAPLAYLQVAVSERGSTREREGARWGGVVEGGGGGGGSGGSRPSCTPIGHGQGERTSEEGGRERARAMEGGGEIQGISEESFRGQAAERPRGFAHARC